MRNHDDGLSQLADRNPQESAHLRRGGRIQVSNGLVRKDNGRFGDEDPGDGHTLLLTTRKLAGPVSQPLLQA